MNFLKGIASPEARQWLYRVSLAVVALLGTLGVITDMMVPTVVALIGALLSISVADANVFQTAKPVKEEANPFDLVFKDEDAQKFTGEKPEDIADINPRG